MADLCNKSNKHFNRRLMYILHGLKVCKKSNEFSTRCMWNIGLIPFHLVQLVGLDFTKH